MNQAAADFIAERLPKGLIHPGDPERKLPPKPLMLPGLSSTGIPQEMLQHFAHEAGLPGHDAPQLWGEAIVHTIETGFHGGSEIIAKSELAQLRAEAATLEDQPAAGASVNVYCRCNKTEPLLTLTIGRPMVITDGQLLAQRIADVCRCN